MFLTNNFHINEFKCKDGTPVPDELKPNVLKLANQLQIIRDSINEPIYINSGYRTIPYNKSVKGSKKSQHIYANAADFYCKNLTPKQLYIIIQNLINADKILDGGLAYYDTFVHYDIGKPRRW